MSRWYRFLHTVGFTPWEEDSETVAPQLGALLDREESTRVAPYGRALDLGCGRGRWSIALARRGWDVVGVDIVPKAVDQARGYAREQGVDVKFLEGDVTALREEAVGSGYSFILDVECFNHLNDSQRASMGRGVTAVAGPDATMLLLVWSRARRGPLPPGASREDLMAAFPDWKIDDEEPYDGELPLPLRRAGLRWYHLSRS